MRTCLLLILALLVGTGSVQGQERESVTLAYNDVLMAGVRAFEAERYDDTVTLLFPLIQAEPTYRDPRLGSVAYWLGKAYEAQGDTHNSRTIWQIGMRKLQSEGSFDPRLAASYLGTLLADPQLLADQVEDARFLYLNLLNNADRLQSTEEKRLLAPHLAHLLLILPDAEQATLLDGTLDANPDAWTVRAGAGPRLIQWWRRQDPLPATEANERLDEHLARVAHASTEYAYTGRLTGLDDRGHIYVRYGEPEKSFPILFTDSELTDLIYSPGSTLSLSDFPDNEAWRYGHIDATSHFLFVRKQGYYQIGETMDLVPRTLQFGLARTQRGLSKSRRLLTTLKVIYQQLNELHPDFGARYADVANYVDERDYRDITTFSNRVIARTETEDQEQAFFRASYAPREATDALRDREVLPIAYRTARFLDPDGTTRTEVYWSVPPEALELGRRLRRQLERAGYTRFDDFGLRVSTVQKAADFSTRVVNVDQYQVLDLPKQNGSIPPRTSVVRGDSGLYHLALQWDQHLLETRRFGPHVKLAAATADSLQALSADPGTLEMSDLRPFLFTDSTTYDANGLPLASPYPFAALTSTTPLAVYFELYHLTFAADDITRYTVEYEITRREEGGLLSFRSDGEARTTARSTYTGTQRTSREFILLDFSDWEGEGTLTVTIRITDQTTGQQVARSLDFELTS